MLRRPNPAFALSEENDGRYIGIEDCSKRVDENLWPPDQVRSCGVVSDVSATNLSVRTCVCVCDMRMTEAADEGEELLFFLVSLPLTAPLRSIERRRGEGRAHTTQKMATPPTPTSVGGIGAGGEGRAGS